MTESPPPTDPMSEDQVSHFSWWLCMLPFVVGAAIFTYIWWQHRIEASAALNLLYALGIMILGLIFSAMVSSGDDSSGTTTSGTTGGGTRT